MNEAGDLQNQFTNLKQLQLSQVKHISAIRDENAEAITRLHECVRRTREEFANLTRDLSRAVADLSKQINSTNNVAIPSIDSPKTRHNEGGQLTEEENSLDYPAYATSFLLDEEIELPTNLKLDMLSFNGENSQEWLFKTRRFLYVIRLQRIRNYYWYHFI